MTDERPPLIPPTPPRKMERSPAIRPASLEDRSVGLVDSMLNPSAGWGSGMLTAVERELRQRWATVTTTRISRPQLGLHQPVRWAAAMAAQHAALVIAVGD